MLRMLILANLCWALSTSAFGSNLDQAEEQLRALLESDAPADEMLEAVNRERTRRGIRPLYIDNYLMKGAQSWARRMRRIGHERGPFAENVAQGQRSIGQAMRSWMNSSGHRANILNGRYSRFGWGHYGRNWVQRFR